MRIHISPRDGVPIYMQIVQQVRRLVASGELVAGDELPSIRALADKLVVNPNTIAHAYRELEAGGLVTSSRGLGTYVADSNQSKTHQQRRAVLIERVDSLVLESHQLKIPFPEVLEIMHERESALRTGLTEQKKSEEINHE